jgi:hypothetical protein
VLPVESAPCAGMAGGEALVASDKKFEVHAGSQLSKLPRMRRTDNPQPPRSIFSLCRVSANWVAVCLSCFSLRLAGAIE